MQEKPRDLIRKRLKRDAPPILYHYTSQSGLMGIIKSRSLWATNIHYLNDNAEFVHAVDYCKNIIEQKKQSEDRPWAVKLLSVFATQFDSMRRVSTYVFSFSEKGDLLSQWRAYAQKAGFSIGFVTSKICESVKGRNFYLTKCIYTWVEQEEILKLLIEEHLLEFSLNMDMDDQNANTLMKNTGLNFRYGFLGLAPLFKHHSFAEEKEWRLISLPIESTNPQIALREGPYSLVPYFNIKLKETPEKDTEDAIMDIGLDTIYLAPGSYSELSSQALIILFSREKIRWHAVNPSSSPYRNW